MWPPYLKDERKKTDIALLTVGREVCKPAVMRTDQITLAGAAEMALPELFRSRVEDSPEKIAVRTVQEEITFSEWGRRSAALASRLQDTFGSLRRERVCLWMTNDEAADFLAGLQATFDHGAVVVALDDRFAPAEASRIFRQADARVLVMGPQVAERLGDDGMTALGMPDWDAGSHQWSGALFEIADGSIARGADLWRAEEGGETATFDPVAAPSDMALIAFTSGSTGTPKGAVWKSSDVVQYAERVSNATYSVPRQGKPLRSDDVLQSPLPLHTAASLIENMYPTVYAGNELIFEGRRFSAERSERRMEEFGTTVYNGVPAMYAMMCSLEERHPGARPELMVTSGSPITSDLYRRMCERWPTTSIANWYGLNESGTGQTLNHGEDMERFPEAIGKPLEPTEVKVVDADLEAVGFGVEGDLLMRGPGQMTEYFRDPEQTALRFRDDWLFTGDRATQDADGLIHVVGRNEERINRGGFKFYPAEIESALTEHEGVREAAVIGVPHPVMGQDTVAFVVANPLADIDDQVLRSHLRKTLAPNKTPAEIVFTDELPRSAYGKVSRRELLARYEAARTAG